MLRYFVTLLALSPAAITAQVTASASVIRMETSVSLTGSPAITTSRPAGTPIIGSLAINTIAIPGIATNAVSLRQSTTEVRLQISQTAIDSSNLRTCSFEGEFALSLTSPAPIAVELETTLGGLGPLQNSALELDLDGDGFYETSIGGTLPSVPVTIALNGTRTIGVRSMGSNTPGNPRTAATRQLGIIIRRAPTGRVQTVLTACSPAELVIEPTFTDELLLSLDGQLPLDHLGFLVFGLSPSLVAPAATPGCFWLPSPDITVPFQRNDQLILDGTLLRGIQLYAQCGVFDTRSADISLTEGYRLRF